MNNKIIVSSLNSINPKYKNEHGYEFKKYEATQRKDFSQAYICFYEIMPEKSAYPKHYHSYNTECFYIINGEGIIEIIDSKIKIKGGDINVFPCGEKGLHKLINTSRTDKLLYIDFDTANSSDIIHYVDSNKIGIWEKNKSCCTSSLRTQ